MNINIDGPNGPVTPAPAGTDDATARDSTPSNPIVEAAVRKVAASYARKSDKNQTGLEDQHEINRMEARRDGYVIPDEFCYEDDDTSGVLVSRRGFDVLEKLIESGAAPPRVYVLDRTRFGRYDDPGQHDYFRIRFRMFGVELRFSRDTNVDYSGGLTPENAAAALVDRMKGVETSTERTRIRTRTMRGRRQRVIRGFWPGSSAPYGTRRVLADLITHQTFEAVHDGKRVWAEGCGYKLQWETDGSYEVIQGIFRAFEVERKSFQAIAADLERRQVPAPVTPARRKGPPGWNDSGVRYILRNPLYAGDLVWGRKTRDAEPVEHFRADPDGSEPILYRNFLPDAPITREQFQSVQRLIEQRKADQSQARSNKPEFLLSSVLFCAVCGARWSGFTSTKQTGTQRRYYRHGTLPGAARTEGGTEQISCPSVRRYLRCSDLDEVILAQVLDYVCTEELREQIAEELVRQTEHTGSARHERRIAGLRRQVDLRTRELDQAVRARLSAEDALIIEAYDRTAASLSNTIRTLQHELHELEQAQQRSRGAAAGLASMLERTQRVAEILKQAPGSRRRAVLREIIQRIDFHPNTGEATVEIRMPPA